MVVIFGAGGLAKEIAWMVEENDKRSGRWEIEGYISEDDPDETKTYHYPIIGNDEWLLEQQDVRSAICAIGDPGIRRRIADKFEQKRKEQKLLFPVVISEHALVADSSEIMEGSVVCAGSVITVDVRIGRFVICDRNSTIGHDSEIGDFVTISPGVNISGNVRIGSNTMIGTGTSVIQGVTIGSNTVIGAGATVISDIPDNCTAVGVPARVIKNHG